MNALVQYGFHLTEVLRLLLSSLVREEGIECVSFPLVCLV